eukprot:scaffold172891_cov17-Prasinocladus_malaysianus.AAC.1
MPEQDKTVPDFKTMVLFWPMRMYFSSCIGLLLNLDKSRKSLGIVQLLGILGVKIGIALQDRPV